MRSREEVLREDIGVYIGSATGAEKDMADRIRSLESPPRPEPVAEVVSDPYQFAAPYAWILEKNGNPQGIPVAHRPSDWQEVERVWGATFTPLYPQRKSWEVLERQWLEACEMGQAYCKRHGITDYGRSVFALLVEDAERLRAEARSAASGEPVAWADELRDALRTQIAEMGREMASVVAERDALKAQQPKVERKLRAYKGVTYRDGKWWDAHVFFTHAYAVLNWDRRKWTDDDHAPLMALKAQPYEDAVSSGGGL